MKCTIKCHYISLNIAYNEITNAMTNSQTYQTINQAYPVEQQSPPIGHIEMTANTKINTYVECIVLPKNNVESVTNLHLRCTLFKASMSKSTFIEFLP